MVRHNNAPHSPTMVPQTAPITRRFALYGGLYVALWIGTWYLARLMNTHGFVSLWFLPAGLRFCNLLVFGVRGVALELIIQGVFALLQITGLDSYPIENLLSVNTLWRLYNLLASLALNAAVLLPLRHRMRENWDFSRTSHSALLLAASLLVSALSALAGSIGLVHLGFISPADQWAVFPKWLIGDFVATITLAPVLLVWAMPRLLGYLSPTQNAPRTPKESESQSALHPVILIVVPSLMLVFGLPWSLGINSNFPIFALLLLLPLGGIALNYGLRGSVMAVLLLDCGLAFLLAFFRIPDALPYQLVMISIALVGLWLGGAVEARNRVMQRYLDFSGVSNDLLWETDVHGRLRETSGRLAAQLAPTPGLSWRAYLGKKFQPQLAEIEQAIERQASFRNLEFEIRSNHGETLWIQINGLPVFDSSGQLLGYRGTAIDISPGKRAEAMLRDFNENLLKEVSKRTRELSRSNGELEAKERHLQVLLAAAPVGVIELDDEQRCRYINLNGCALTGLGEDQALGSHFLDFVHPDDRAYVEFVWTIHRPSEEVQWIDFRLRQTNLRCAAHWIRLSPSEHATEGTIMVLTNATARSRQDERLWTLAHHDALTDLPNRNLFWDRIGQALQHAKRRDSGAALLWIDLDGFKKVNDDLGHGAGDNLLQQVGQRLKSRTRDSDTVARMGGDEFAVIMPDTLDAEGAILFASALVTIIAEPFDLPLGTVRISASIGIALYPQHADSVEALTQCADMAMYAAKRAGKNQVKVYASGDSVANIENSPGRRPSTDPSAR